MNPALTPRTNQSALPLNIKQDSAGNVNGVELDVIEPNGTITTHEGLTALLNAPGYGEEMASKNPLLAAAVGTTLPNDPRNTWSYRTGRKLREMIQSPGKTALGHMTDTGAVGGGFLGAGAGLLAGIAAERMTGNTLLPLLAISAGTALGAGVGHGRKKLMEKSSAMYHDPRNFILEKLQAATDLGMADKAALAASVRNLELHKAEKLASLVRSAVGYGVGSIIAKFIFGSDSRLGSLFGGMLGMSVAQSLLAPSFHSTITPNTYYDTI